MSTEPGPLQRKISKIFDSKNPLKTEYKTTTGNIRDDLDESFKTFKTTNPKYMLKKTDANEVRKKREDFYKYLEDDQIFDKMGRGISYVLWKRPCDYINAQEAFGINAYDEQEGIVKLKRIRKERDELQLRYRKLFTDMVNLEVQKINYKRILRNQKTEPQVVAKSSGHLSNGYVYGYGYTYGVGYSDEGKVSTAPGFELTATKHVQNVIKTFSPIIGNGDFDDLYYEIFDIKKIVRKRKPSVTFHMPQKPPQ